METFDLKTSPAIEIGRQIKAGKISAVEAALHIIREKEQQDPILGAYLHFDGEALLKNAADVQRKIGAGELDGPLAGVPIAIKDNICTKGIPTTCASRMLERFVPPFSATAALRLEEGGLILAGKCNMDEFAMGSTTETSYFKKTKNPWNPAMTPGGSSGGSAAAVSSGMAYCALGSDTGGSIRLPSAFCGVTGLKPTYGSVSRFGLIAHASSLDQIGPIARDAADCAAIFDRIQGFDEKDSTCVTRRQSDHLEMLDTFLAKNAQNSKPLRGIRLGIPNEYLDDGISPEVRAAIFLALKAFETLGAECESFSMPTVRYAIPTYYILASAEASSNLSRYDGVKYGTRAENPKDLADLYLRTRSENFGDEVARRILLGSFVLSSGYFDAYYQTALKARRRIKNEFDAAFAKYDAIIGPTSPDTAPPLGESLKNPLKMYLNDIYTVSVNLAGLPAMSLPCGFASDRMPIGLQLIADAFAEDKLFKLGAMYQKITSHHLKRPENRKESQIA